MPASVKGIPQLSARLNAIMPGTTLLPKLALAVVHEQKLLVPRKTGNLGRSIHIGSITPKQAETVASADYAAYVEFGTRPHEIRPRRKKVLRYAASSGDARLSGTPRTGGRVRFSPKVSHPGTRAQPFMLPGAHKGIEGLGLKAIVVDLWNRAA